MTSVAATFRPHLFQDHQVLVSGGTSGIGLAIARGFVALGATVLATGSSESEVTALKAEGAPDGLAFRVLDVRDLVAVRALVGSLAKLDVLSMRPVSLALASSSRKKPSWRSWTST